eukprot:m.62926 g.62926  ORF g.62926 m.62926 type:complete len:853 (+) comp19412_c0_seq4:117-2675(+)
MLGYCGELDMLPAWQQHGISPCLWLTITSCASFGWLFFVGGTSLLAASKGAVSLPHSSFLLSCRVSASIIIAVSYLAHFILVTALDRRPTEYILVCDVLSCMAWLLAIKVVFSRARRSLGDAPGFILFTFFVIEVARACVEVASYRSSLWYFRRFSDINEPLPPRHSNTHDGNLGQFILFCARAAGLVFLAISSFITTIVAANRNKEYTLLTVNRPGVDSESGSPSRKLLGTVKQRTGSAFAGFFGKVKQLWPFVWPRDDAWLQLRVLLCLTLLAGGRVVNLFVPLCYKKVVDDLTPKGDQDPQADENRLKFPWEAILVYVVLRFLQGGGMGSMGVLNNLRSFFWIRVQQYTARRIRKKLFAHLHSLSLRWHLSRKTGEVLRMMDRGTTSINSVLSSIVFSILPTLVDIAIAIAYFTSSFGSYFGLIVFVTMASYITVTIYLTEWRTKFRRNMNSRDNTIRQKAVDSLLNFETVKLYCGEDFEVKRFDDTVADYQHHEWTSLSSLALLNSTQNVVITAGLLGGALLCGYLVAQGDLTVGDFVLFIAYIVQLYAPLNWFGTYYRTLQQNFIDMENMLDLMNIEPEVQDKPSAIDLPPPPPSLQGVGIKFEGVSFAYEPRRAVLKNVSFEVPPGQTYAIVGPTGSGKSTIMRLLFRFYDLQEGKIFVNGQDISQVKKSSLRKIMGVVPQDTVLFHDTIKYNVKYGNMAADEEQVVEAAKGADIHEKIECFPDQYETVVGERGLKLSGGEKQRVAIARTILKNPQVVLLDEATSALDTETERNIQASLDRICANRTTLCIAHRLSTVIGADMILVLKNGEIVERGNHHELLRNRAGVYHEMWVRQLEAHNQSSEQ